MLGGQESFAEGKFHRTPIGDMLPVYLDQIPEVTGTDAASTWKLNLTREGWLQPWARLRNNEVEERARLEATVPFQVLNRVRGVKPGASVIASVAGRAKQFPAVVVQRFGNGRTGAVLIGDLWRSGLQDEQMSKDLAKGWRQWVRWLVADVPNRVELRAVDTAGDPNRPVVLQVRARDPKFQPLDNAAVKIIVRGVTKSGVTNQSALPASIELDAEPVLSEAGLYRAVYVPRANGGYYAEAVVTNATGVEAGRSAAGWSTDLAAAEFRTLKPNRALLADIAKKTGGEVIEDRKLESFAETLPERKVPIVENWSYPLWNTPWVFLFALGCFIAEWGLRRWKGLA